MAGPVFLPAEIWHHILTEAALDSDACELWTTARQVSRDWRSTIAQVYCDVYLRDPTRFSLRFDTDTWTDLQPRFDRFVAGNHSRCVFKFQADNGPSRLPEYPEKIKYVERAIRRYIGDGESQRRFELTPHIICLDGKCMDSDLPDLSFDKDRSEISFDWDAMLTNFFYEISQLRQQDLIAAREVGAHFAGVYGFPEDHHACNDFMDSLDGAKRATLTNIRRRRIVAAYGDSQCLDFLDTMSASAEENLRLKWIQAATEAEMQKRSYDLGDEETDDDESIIVDFTSFIS